VLGVASKELKLALMLALWTGQRQGDLLALPWSAYDSTTIKLKQSKSSKSVAIKVGFPLKEPLDKTPRRSTLILTNQRGAGPQTDSERRGAKWSQRRGSRISISTIFAARR
jgi:integrase